VSVDQRADALEEREYALVICDISGYTRFVSGHQEVRNHGFVVVGQLLKAVLRSVAPDLKLSKVEGDAVFLFRALPPDAAVRREALLHVVTACDRAFESFAERRRELVQANICPCEACQSAKTLDLKIVLSSGGAVMQRIGSHRELAGLEVIRVHRLLKNRVGMPHYLLVTEATAAALGEVELPPYRAACESHEELGDCPVRVYEPPLGLAARHAEKSYGSVLYKAKDILTKIVVGRLYQFGVLPGRPPGLASDR
jgi:hypothetical protein